MAPNKPNKKSFFAESFSTRVEFLIFFWVRQWQVADVISSNQPKEKKERKKDEAIFTERCDVQGSVAFLGGRIDGGATFQQLRHDVNVAFLGSQM
jgi:hypothetical protein